LARAFRRPGTSANKTGGPIPLGAAVFFVGGLGWGAPFTAGKGFEPRLAPARLRQQFLIGDYPAVAADRSINRL
jgi:hypothetical protein